MAIAPGAPGPSASPAVRSTTVSCVVSVFINRASDGSIQRSDEAEARLAALRRGSDREGGDLALPDLGDLAAVAAWRRAQHDAWGEDLAEGEAPHQEIVVSGIRTLWAGPAFDPGDLTQSAIVYFHGGGFCLGTPWTSAPITARLARPHASVASPSVVSIDYRLAPEYPFPAAIDDAESVVRSLLAGRRLVLAGDSAGANIAFGLWQRLDQGSVSQPSAAAAGADRSARANVHAIIGLSPHLDLRRPPTRESEPLGAAYVGHGDAGDPSISPAAMSDDLLARLPPLLLQSTTSERMHPTVETFAARVSAVGGTVEHQIWDGLWHAWHYHRELPEASDAIDRAVAFARRHLPATSPERVHFDRIA